MIECTIFLICFNKINIYINLLFYYPLKLIYYCKKKVCGSTSETLTGTEVGGV